MPRSVIYPSISFDILEGLRGGIMSQGIADVDIRTDNIGLAAHTPSIYAVCEKMLFDGVQVVVGYINPDSAIVLQPLFEQAGAVFIAIDAGYQFARSMQLLNNVFTISLQGAHACRVLGRLAAQHGSSRIAYAGSFYDAGYRSSYTFFNGLYDHGGQVTFNHVTKLKRSDFTISDYAAYLQENEGDAIFASFCADMAQDFCGGVQAAGLLSRHRAYCSSFMAEEMWLNKIPYPGGDISTCVTWASGLKSDANMLFKESMQHKRKEANVFSLLGWEAALFVSGILKNEHNDLIAALEHATYTGPRGLVKMDAATHECVAPLYMATIIKNETNGNCTLLPGSPIDERHGDREGFLKDRAAFTQGTSWLNAYPCLDN